jgi:4'-phosphopantetheinyl transferase
MQKLFGATTAPRTPIRARHLQIDEIRVWHAPLDLDEAILEPLLGTLSPDERERAARFRFTRDAVRFAAGRVALRTGLAECLGVDPHTLLFHYGPHGKPELAPPFDRAGVRFNASRSEGVGLYAAARNRRVGVDIEYVRPFPDLDEVAAISFSPREQRRWHRLAPAERLVGFYNCWTRKEAYLKAVGNGLADGPARVTVSLAPDMPARLDHVAGDPLAPTRWKLGALDVHPGYVAAIAMEVPTE